MNFSLSKVIRFFNTNDGFSMVILTAVLALITFYYARLTKKLSDNSLKSVNLSDQNREDNKNRQIETKNNYLSLLNAEIIKNAEMYVLTLYYLQNPNKIQMIEKMRIIVNGNKSVEKLSKAFIINHIKSTYWDSIYSEGAKLFSFKLMQELVLYYSEIYHSRIFSIAGMSNEKFIEFAKSQLVRSYKCFDLIDKEGIQYERKIIYEIDDRRFKFDIDTESLIEI